MKLKTVKPGDPVPEDTPVVEVGSEFVAAVQDGEVVLKHPDELTAAQAANLGVSEVADATLADTVVLGDAEVAQRVADNV